MIIRNEILVAEAKRFDKRRKHALLSEESNGDKTGAIIRTINGKVAR